MSGASAEVLNVKAPASDLQFYRTCITAMAVVLVSGFVLNLAMGRSSFAAPLVIHAHAFAAMGFVGVAVIQAWLAAAGQLRLHRTLGLAGIAITLALSVSGILVTLSGVQTGRVPFFFQPQHFLIANPATVLAFLGLLGAAVMLRKRTDWHARLQIGAFVMLMGPGFGRLLPMPFLTPYAFEAASLVALAVPVIGMVRDRQVHGRAHPAWWVPVIVLVGLLVVSRLAAFSPAGEAVYAAVTQGTAMEGTDGTLFPPPPPLPPLN